MTRTPQRIKILRILAKGIPLTPIKALRMVGTLSLSQRCGELIREGWPIRSRLIRVGGKHVCEYRYQVKR